MKCFLFILISLVIVGCSNLKGDEGPVGPQGDDGNPGPGSFYVTEGILYSSAKSPDGDWWDIDLSHWNLNDSAVLQCWVRQGAGYMWKEPNWYWSTTYVRILDDAITDPADEYRVVQIDSY